MSEQPKDSGAGRRCPQCGAELPANLPSQLCPKCLLKTGLDTEPQTGPTGTIVVGADRISSALPQPGEQLGHYRILRSLGGGGMGAVFEAEDLENGRRIALKVLSKAPDSPEARERFLREGRLAASINHPNSVYVFGTEEVGGVPLISMELVAGGTLEDRIRARGPMPAAEAVDAVLQIVAGLEAAQRIGILHRDVKPSNCFVDADGTVKIGDFGLSISTSTRTEPTLTASGSFLGTPAFCSPEQLRGEELNSRSDMYSVGATLFYLLTGQTPFQAKNMVALLAIVLEQPAPSPGEIQPALPRGLCRVVRRCLEKQPTERFDNYEELRKSLAPYSSAAPVPAQLGLRLAAGLLDMLSLGGVMSILAMLGPFNFFRYAILPRPVPGLLAPNWWAAVAIALIALVVSVLYYAVLEGRWGLTVGKLACGLRVTGPDRNAPGFRRAFLSALIYVLVPVLPSTVMYWWNPQAYLSKSTVFQVVMGFSFYLLLGLLFSTARRKNGFAAVHDLVTKTRVVVRTTLSSRVVPVAGEVRSVTVESVPLIGPYHVLETLEEHAGTAWKVGYDVRLLRKVWIHIVPPGTPAVPPWTRNLGRVGRLRWLTGVRSAEGNWDAFEAVTGRPLLQMLREGGQANPQPWAQVRFWLCDMASELAVAAKDGTMPPLLDLDRVWITGDGRAKILDFPAPGLAGLTGTPGAPEALSSANPPQLDQGEGPRFLSRVAAAGLQGRVEAAARPPVEVSMPLPLHVRQFLQSLPQFVNAEAVQGALGPLLERMVAVTRLRRAGLVMACAAVPLFFACMYLFGMSMLEDWNRRSGGLFNLNQVLQQRTALQRWARKAPQPTDRQYAIYIASHYREAITNETMWSNAFSLSLIKGESRRFAEESVAQFAEPTDTEIADADAAIKKIAGPGLGFATLKGSTFIMMMAGGAFIIYVCLPAIIAALAFRGGLILLAGGVTYVRRDGRLASRLRLFWRSLVVWSPLVPLLFFLGFCNAFKWPAGAVGALVLYAGLAVFSALLPQRGLQDRLAGTWPVPR